ncbi:hypothetical protein AAG906_005535 [Vitis piasezkii]
MLAKVIRFSIGKDGLKQDKNGDIISRKWVCSREGHRATKFIENDKRRPAFRIGLNRKYGKWIVKEFIGEHNHNLVDAISTQFLRSHRIVSNLDKIQVDVLRKVGVKTTQIMDYMVKQSGGHQHVGFTQKDIYNHIDAMRRIEIKDGDAEIALAYLCGKVEMDSLFFYKFNVDEESRLANLFWADSTARMDYACFGDVLAFDTTYRTIAYKKPLVVLVDESVGTYEWVLETFLITMMNKKPISVVTDGDKAMCKDFTSIFAKCMFMRGNAEEFEKVWHEMVANLGLHENRWVTEIYGKCKRWAEAYLRGNFFGGMRSTQRAIMRIRQNEAKAEFESNNYSPVLLTKLSILENHATTIYTKESFLKFREEIKNAEFFFVVDLVEHLEEIHLSCILNRWTKLAKVHTRSAPMNEMDNDMDWFMRYGSLSSMCNKLSYYQNLMVRMEELYNNNLKGKKVAVDGATSPNQVCDPNIVKTKGNPGKVATNFQKGRRCSRCKRVGHTIRKCLEARIPQTGHQRDMVCHIE